MSLPVDFLASAFFDEPGLLAVRFRGHAITRAHDAVAWATRRQPDTNTTGMRAVLPLIAVGVTLAVVIGTVSHSGSSSRSHEKLPNSAPSQVDAQSQQTWHGHLIRLADDLGPVRADLRPFVVRTLLDLPRELATRGSTNNDWLQPGLGAPERNANQRALQLARELDELGCDHELAVILDLPGPQSIAVGAALANRCDPVPTFDNLPHPQGVVPAYDTLAAAVAWAGTYQQTKATQRADPAALFLLDGNRLNPYTNESGTFDNRSHARLPSAAAFHKLGIRRIVYVREQTGAVAGRDDLNSLFVDLQEADIAIHHVGLDRFPITVDPTASVTTTPATNSASSGASGHVSSAYWWRHLYHPDDDYRSQRRVLPMEMPGPFNGGLADRDRLISRFNVPPDTSSSGGSWGRSWSSSSG